MLAAAFARIWSGAVAPSCPNDLLIAATALAHDLTLVTHNASKFGRVPGLRVDDWEA